MVFGDTHFVSTHIEEDLGKIVATVSIDRYNLVSLCDLFFIKGIGVRFVDKRKKEIIDYDHSCV